MTPVAGFIIVRRDDELRDEAIFTGGMRLVPTWESALGSSFLQPDGETSSHIEHALVFGDLAQAYHWRDLLLISEKGPQSIWRWAVRKDGEFYPGEAHQECAPRPSVIDLGMVAGLGSSRKVQAA